MHVERPTGSVNADRREAVNMAVYRMSPLIATDFDELVDHVGPLNRWPVNMAEAIVSTHLTFQQRFQLTLFLLGNRVPPTVFIAWFLRRNMLKDISARRHVAGILLAHKTGKLEADGKTTWVVGAVDKEGNELKDKNQVIATPRFADDEPQYWDEAIKKLNMGNAAATLPMVDWHPLSVNAILPYRMPCSTGTTPLFADGVHTRGLDFDNVQPAMGPVFLGLDVLTGLAANITPIASPLRD